MQTTKPVNEQLIIPKKVQQLGDVTQLAPSTLKASKVREKLDVVLQQINSHREKPLRLVEIVSASRQIINGITYVFHVRLREEGSHQVKDYKITFFEVLGDDPSVEAFLRSVKRA